MKEKLIHICITGPYWVGAAADLLWAIALLFPSIFGTLTGQEQFAPDLRVKLTMGVGATLMFGWSILLVWGVQSPIERRFIILLTAFPVVFGLGVISLISYVYFNGTSSWIILKTILLMAIMLASYCLSERKYRQESK